MSTDEPIPPRPVLPSYTGFERPETLRGTPWTYHPEYRFLHCLDCDHIVKPTPKRMKACLSKHVHLKPIQQNEIIRGVLSSFTDLVSAPLCLTTVDDGTKRVPYEPGLPVWHAMCCKKCNSAFYSDQALDRHLSDCSPVSESDRTVKKDGRSEVVPCQSFERNHGLSLILPRFCFETLTYVAPSSANRPKKLANFQLFRIVFQRPQLPVLSEPVSDHSIAHDFDNFTGSSLELKPADVRSIRVVVKEMRWVELHSEIPAAQSVLLVALPPKAADGRHVCLTLDPRNLVKSFHANQYLIESCLDRFHSPIKEAHKAWHSALFKNDYLRRNLFNKTDHKELRALNTKTVNEYSSFLVRLISFVLRVYLSKDPWIVAVFSKLKFSPLLIGALEKLAIAVLTTDKVIPPSMVEDVTFHLFFDNSPSSISSPLQWPLVFFSSLLSRSQDGSYLSSDALSTNFQRLDHLGRLCLNHRQAKKIVLVSEQCPDQSLMSSKHQQMIDDIEQETLRMLTKGPSPYDVLVHMRRITSSDSDPLTPLHNIQQLDHTGLRLSVDGTYMSLDAVSYTAKHLIDMLWDSLVKRLMFNRNVHINISELPDRTTDLTPGFSFNKHPDSPLYGSERFLLDQMLSDPDLSSMFRPSETPSGVSFSLYHVNLYLLMCADFLKMLSVAILITVGALPRGTELLSVKFANVTSAPRDIYISHGSVSIYLRYSKTDNIKGRSSIRVYLLPPALAAIVVRYIAFVCPFMVYLRSTVSPVGTDHSVSRSVLFADPCTGQAFNDRFVSAQLGKAFEHCGFPGVGLNMFRQGHSSIVTSKYGLTASSLSDPSEGSDRPSPAHIRGYGHTTDTHLNQYDLGDDAFTRKVDHGSIESIAFSRTYQRDIGVLEYIPQAPKMDPKAHAPLPPPRPQVRKTIAFTVVPPSSVAPLDISTSSRCKEESVSDGPPPRPVTPPKPQIASPLYRSPTKRRRPSSIGSPGTPGKRAARADDHQDVPMPSSPSPMSKTVISHTSDALVSEPTVPHTSLAPFSSYVSDLGIASLSIVQPQPVLPTRPSVPVLSTNTQAGVSRMVSSSRGTSQAIVIESESEEEVEEIEYLPPRAAPSPFRMLGSPMDTVATSTAFSLGHIYHKQPIPLALDDASLKKALFSSKFSSFKDQDQIALVRFLAQRDGDAFVSFPPGKGKTLGYHLSSVIPGSRFSAGITVVFCPLRYLIDQSMRSLASMGVNAHRWNRHLNIANGYVIMSGSCMAGPHFVDWLTRYNSKIVRVIVEEVHVFAFGTQSGYRHDLKQSLDGIGVIRSRIPKDTPWVYVSATVNPLVRQHLLSCFGSPHADCILLPALPVSHKFTARNGGRLSFESPEGISDMCGVIRRQIEYLRSHVLEPSDQIMIFVGEVRHAQALATGLGVGEAIVSEKNVKSDPDTAARMNSTLDDFQNLKTDVIVSTSVLGTGVSLPNVAWVLLLYLSSSVSEFVQIIGRAGRTPDTALRAGSTVITTAESSHFIDRDKAVSHIGVDYMRLYLHPDLICRRMPLSSYLDGDAWGPPLSCHQLGVRLCDLCVSSGAGAHEVAVDAGSVKTVTALEPLDWSKLVNLELTPPKSSILRPSRATSSTSVAAPAPATRVAPTPVGSSGIILRSGGLRRQDDMPGRDQIVLKILELTQAGRAQWRKQGQTYPPTKQTLKPHWARNVQIISDYIGAVNSRCPLCYVFLALTGSDPTGSARQVHPSTPCPWLVDDILHPQKQHPSTPHYRSWMAKVKGKTGSHCKQCCVPFDAGDQVHGSGPLARGVFRCRIQSDRNFGTDCMHLALYLILHPEHALHKDPPAVYPAIDARPPRAQRAPPMSDDDLSANLMSIGASGFMVSLELYVWIMGLEFA